MNPARVYALYSRTRAWRAIPSAAAAGRERARGDATTARATAACTRLQIVAAPALLELVAALVPRAWRARAYSYSIVTVCSTSI